MEKVEEMGRRNPITLIIQRSDYLTAEELGANGRRQIHLKQIEVINSIGKGQGMGHQISRIHQRMLDKIKHSKSKVPQWLREANVELGDGVKKQAKALYEAWKLFRRMHNAQNAIILLISVPKRKHYCHFEQLLWAQFELENIAWAEGDSPHVELLTFEEMSKKLFLTNENGKLHLYLNDGNDQRRKVAIAHFHDGFMPEHFKTPEEWQIREQMELSTAIMSPSVYLHLLGSKTVQQELAKEGAVEKYFSDQAEKAELVRKLRGTFIEMWALGENDEAIVGQAIRHSNDFVLKANTDGGKGNFFDDKMAKMLKELRMNSEERSKYILQKRINPFRIKNAIIPRPPLADNSIKFAEMDTEIGIFGSFLGITEKGNKHGQLAHQIHFNAYDGYFIRTKLSTNAQCNMSMGKGGTDSIVLFPQDNFENIPN